MAILENLSDELLLEIFARVHYTPSNFEAVALTSRRFHRVVRTKSLAQKTAWVQFKPLMLLMTKTRGSADIDWYYLNNMLPAISSQNYWVEFLRDFTIAHHDVVTTGVALADFLVSSRTMFYWTTHHRKERRYDAVGFSRVLRTVLPPAAIMLLRFITDLMYRALFLQQACVATAEIDHSRNVDTDLDGWKMHNLFSFCKFEGKFLKNPGMRYKEGSEEWRGDRTLYRLGGKSIHNYFTKGTDQKLHRSGRIVLLAIHQALTQMAESGYYLHLPEAGKNPTQDETLMNSMLEDEESLMYDINDQVRGLFEDRKTAFLLLDTLDLVAIGKQIQEVYRAVSKVPQSLISLDVGQEVDMWGLREWPQRVHVKALSTLVQ